MLQRRSVTFFVSGEKHTVNADNVVPETTLNTYLRDIAKLTGTKKMCLEGGCGTCTVAVETVVDGQKHVFSVNSCLVSIYSCHGWEIHTIEGIGNPLKGYHQIQKLLSDNYGTQCGFCSPGMVMNMYALHESGPKTKKEIENSFSGNICRCTGYRPILHAFKQLASDAKEQIPDIEELKLCPNEPGKVCTNSCTKTENSSFFLDFGESKWMKVHTFQDLLEVLDVTTDPNYILVSGNTARGVYKKDPVPKIYIDLRDVKELTQYSIDADRLILGANITLTNFINICNMNSSTKNFSFLADIAHHLDLVATVQIRNVGSIAGNLMIKHKHNEFPSDVFLLLETFKASLIIANLDGTESFSQLKDFLNIDMTKKVIKNVVINALDESYTFATYKIMPRAQNAHAMVNAGFLIQTKNSIIQKARIVYGGINPKFIHASNAETMVIGKNLYLNNTIQSVCNALAVELNPDYVLPDPTPEYRKQLAISLFYKFVLKTCPPYLISNRFKSGGAVLDRPLSTGSQEYGTNQQLWPLTQPIPKLESLAQTTGQAEYIMDMPALPREACAAFVTAKAVPGSTIEAVDTSEVLKMDGVIAYYDKKDIPGSNNFTPNTVTIFYVEEELFCSGIVQYYHQPIGIIVANDQDLAWKAAELVKIQYGPPKFKAYLNMKDVIKDDVKDRIINLQTVEPKRKGNDIKKVLKGEFYIGHQYHYHMEVQECQVVPTEDGINMFPATQWMDAVQLSTAAVLGIPESKINISVRRLGGGFGGKISRCLFVSSATALAAYKLKIPVKMVLPFEQNMNLLGRRYPLYTKYEVGVNDKGVIQYLNSDLYSDFGVGGNDPFYPFLAHCFENCYNVDTWHYSINMVKTDTAANTYCRAPGSTEGFACIESIMHEIANNLNLDPLDVKNANMNSNEVDVMKYLTELKSWSQIDQTKKNIQLFNKANRWVKKGIAVVPMKFIIEIPRNFTIYLSIFHGDGSVAIFHGGIEMGQGINTKAAQVCAYKLGIPLDQISVKPSDANIAPNSDVTGRSFTSEGVCLGVIRACDTLLERMKPVREKMPNATWKELIKACFDTDIQLSATGFYDSSSVPQYTIYGVCAVTVEVDILTGQHQILQADIIEDLGQSMSPIVDVGQIEGAFVMGLGYHTTEELIFDNNGQLLTNRTWNYKPPGAKDIPINFRIRFAENSINPGGVLNSKAVAEPPLCLTAAVPLAIRDALASARLEADVNNSKWVSFDGPTTVEKTFLYSLNNYKQYILK